MVSISDNTEITLLSPQGTGIACESKGCEQSAAFLFRTDEGPINAFCEVHASEISAKAGISLPERSHKVLRAGWSF
jgi:hypothetical protein